jgi:DNA-directed RNA polymerase subunit RPC12/RpoP
MAMAKECAACGWDGSLTRKTCNGCGEQKWYCSDCHAGGKGFNCAECQAHSETPACPGFQGDPDCHPCECGDHAHCGAGPAPMLDRKCFMCGRIVSVPDFYMEESTTYSCPRCSQKLDPEYKPEPYTFYGVYDKQYVETMARHLVLN